MAGRRDDARCLYSLSYISIDSMVFLLPPHTPVFGAYYGNFAIQKPAIQKPAFLSTMTHTILHVMLVHAMLVLATGIPTDRHLLFATMPSSGSPAVPQDFAFDCSAVERLPAQTNPTPTWDINLVELTVVDLGNGAYALVDGEGDTRQKNEDGIAAPTSGGFIVTPAGIVVVETYLNYHTACQARNLIVQTAPPNVPIKFVVCTSAHLDHCSGNSVFVAEGVKFVQHQETFHLLSDADYLAGDKTFMMNALGYNAGIQETTPITADMVMLLAADSDLELTLGHDTVVAKYFGRAQTHGDLFVWHESSQTLFTGNPIIAAVGPSLPWFLDGNVQGGKQALVNFKAFVQAQATPPQIVPGHGVISTAGASIATSYINYINELQDLTAEAIMANMSLTQA